MLSSSTIARKRSKKEETFFHYHGKWHVFCYTCSAPFWRNLTTAEIWLGFAEGWVSGCGFRAWLQGTEESIFFIFMWSLMQGLGHGIPLLIHPLFCIRRSRYRDKSVCTLPCRTASEVSFFVAESTSFIKCHFSIWLTLPPYLLCTFILLFQASSESFIYPRITYTLNGESNLSFYCALPSEYFSS